MATNKFQKLAVAIASAASLFAGIEAHQGNLAQAAILTYDFNVTISDTDGNSQLEGKGGFGQITYDDSTLGIESKIYSNPSFVSSYFFNFVNMWTGEPVTYTLGNTREMKVGVDNGRLSYIADFQKNYFVYFQPNLKVQGGDLNSEVKFLGTYSAKPENKSSTTIPEPNTVVGLSVFGLCWLLKRKKVG